MGERIGRRGVFAIAAATAVEACGSREAPQQRTARGFVSALAEGEADRAASFFAPDVRRDPTLYQYLTPFSRQLQGCVIESIVVRQNPVGVLVGAAEQATVTFQNNCGKGEGVLAGAQFTAVVVGLDRAGDKYYVNPLVIAPIPVSSAQSRTAMQERRETPRPPPIKILPFKVEVTQARPWVTYRPYPAPTPWIGGPPRPEEGWKWVYVFHGIENSGNQSQAMPKSSATLVTHEGFEYKEGEGGCAISPGVVLPPRFRILGYWNYGGYGELDGATFALRCFKIAEKTTPSKIKFTGLPDVDLTKGIVDIGSLKFPTDRPDSDFEEFVGTEVTVGDKGKIVFVGVNEVPKPGGYNKNGMDIVLRLKVTNASLGKDTTFSLNFPGIFSDDGIFYHSGEAGRNVSVGPGLSKEYQVALWMPRRGVRGKLPVGGDITKIFNLNF